MNSENGGVKKRMQDVAPKTSRETWRGLLEFDLSRSSGCALGGANSYFDRARKPSRLSQNTQFISLTDGRYRCPMLWLKR
jgi:hypothetical protein